MYQFSNSFKCFQRQLNYKVSTAHAHSFNDFTMPSEVDVEETTKKCSSFQQTHTSSYTDLSTILSELTIRHRFRQ
jgi:hypothetical protein